MNPGNLVRVHLRQVLLIGDGKASQYTHTLIGERQTPLEGQHGGRENFVPILVTGFARGGVSRNLERPALHLLAANNILSIETVKADEGYGCAHSGITTAEEHRCCSRSAGSLRNRGYQHTLVCTGTPESLWGHRPLQTRKVHHLEVESATRIIQLRADGTYYIVKDVVDKNAAFADAMTLASPYPPLPSRPTLRLKDEVILLFGEGGR